MVKWDLKLSNFERFGTQVLSKKLNYNISDIIVDLKLYNLKSLKVEEITDSYKIFSYPII